MNHKAKEKITRPVSPRSRKQEGHNRLVNQMNQQGVQTGENFNIELYTRPIWRPHSPEKWMDKASFKVPTSQTLLVNLKDKVEKET